MAWLWQHIKLLVDPMFLSGIVDSYGWLAYALLFAIILAETGLLVAFLPGDSLLFIAGFVCSAASAVFLKRAEPALNIWILVPLLCVAAIVGDTIGFGIGKAMGPALFRRPDSWLFNQKNLRKTHEFYERHGGKTIIYARFIPIVRTFAPVVAGVGGMDYRRFIAFNVFGGIGWIVSMTVLGYFLGGIPIIQRNLEKAVIVVIVVSVLPIVFEYLKERRAAKVA